MSDRVAERAWQVLSVMAVAAACLTAPAAAEPAAVGLDAQGVDIRASLVADLDVRDAFNRPVSRALVERQLAQGLASADPSRFVSTLPLIQALWDAINRVLLGVGLRGGKPADSHSTPLGRFFRLPKPDGKPSLVFAALSLVLAMALSYGPAGSRPAPASSRPVVLRC